MEEFNDLISLPTAHRVTYDIMHSGEFLYQLENMTGIVGLLPDPHLVGAGYSILRKGTILSPHFDFNWNDRLRLHRKLTGLLYITPNWKSEWGGHNVEWTGNQYKIPSNHTLINDSKAGILAQGFNSEAIELALLEITSSEQNWLNYSQSGKAWVKKNGDWIKSERALHRLYSNALSKGRYLHRT
jgi:hypothetical protein